MDDSETMLDRLAARTEATAEFVDELRNTVGVGDMQWSDVEADYRRLAINNAVRRQLESLDATILLARQGLGHLAVPYVRPALEDLMYLKFFVTLSVEDAQDLFTTMGVWDQVRSVMAQHEYIGTKDMLGLWYPQYFLDEAPANRDKYKAKLKRLQKKYKWAGGDVPSGAWVAEQAGESALYNYLFAATSRAIHFSAGEVMRRGWGMPGGICTTDKPEFRSHLAAFALDQLVRLFLQTWLETSDLHEKAGLGDISDLQFEGPIKDKLKVILSLGRVPLLHAHEFNLTPDGSLIYPEKKQ
ncbi:MAG: DUF5677 domain-containing protein [Actinomycetota bacterium]|nr:DUF5677 domain-containing protein [Actinomycetota bacterium]